MNTKIITIDPRKLKLLDLNARFMRHEEFQKLVANIKKDGQLTSAPFGCKDGDSYLVLSGNHRVKAAIAAGLTEIVCIVTDDDLSEDQKLSIQLSHNALVGQDDPYVLKEIYSKILDLGWKEYSGLDDKTLELLDKANTQSLSEANLKFQTLAIEVGGVVTDLETAANVSMAAAYVLYAKDVFMKLSKMVLNKTNTLITEEEKPPDEYQDVEQEVD